jgi:hypothetical protein
MDARFSNSRGHGLISRSPQPFDFYVNEAARLLREDIRAYRWQPVELLARQIANALSISYDTSKSVVSDLHELGLLEANYGHYRVKRGSFSV